MSKAIIFDAGTLISLSMNGLIDELEELKKLFKGKFIITKEVKYEVIDRPIKIKRFELEAMNIQRILNKKVLEMPASMGIDEKQITKESENWMNIANSSFKDSEKNIHLIDMGETSCLVLAKMLEKKEVDSLVAVDERTMRMLCEKPENLKQLLKKKFHKKIFLDKQKVKKFEGFKLIRSCELIYMAHKKGLTDLHGKKALEAYMYALRFKGCSISNEEISEISKLG